MPEEDASSFDRCHLPIFSYTVTVSCESGGSEVRDS